MTVRDVDEALATLGSKASMLVGGKQVKANIREAITSTSVTRTIDGAPTLTLGVTDPHREIIASNIFGHRLTTHLKPFTYEVVSISKSGTAYTVTCEDQAVAALRHQKGHLKVKAGRMTHIEFARQMVRDVRWLKFRAPYTKAIKSLKELTRGDPKSKDSEPESTWDALQRIASERGWRCFIRGVDEVWYVPDTYLFDQAPMYTLREGHNGVDNMDFEIDEGQPVAELSFTARSAMWAIPPGIVVSVEGLGPANGKWLVAEVSRTPDSLTTGGRLVKPQPTLPEPKDDDKGKQGEDGGSGSKATVDTGSGGEAPDTTNSKRAADFVNEALSQKGKSYVYGSTPTWRDQDPNSFDCSALVQWAAARVGVTVPRTSGQQYAACRQAGRLISVERAEHIRGALLFEGSAGSQHVVISLGNGETIEARGTAYGVGKFSTAGRPWTGAGLIPGMKY